MRSAVRPLSFLVLALLAGAAGAPLLAVTCVPSAPCAGLMEGCPLASAKQTDRPVVSAPDCCERSVRDGEPAAVAGAKVGALTFAALPAVVADLPPAPRPALQRATRQSAAAAAVPLYTLHSILLI